MNERTATIESELKNLNEKVDKICEYIEKTRTPILINTIFRNCCIFVICGGCTVVVLPKVLEML
jgi:hypothetical protein